ncbi:MAG: tetratricopeptide repeat protein [Bacteroidota bacterium]|nr:tetratricopeptide repeat protein [Bacteroidota bacterium]
MIKKQLHILIVFLLFLAVGKISAQDQKAIDSLKGILSTEQPDTVKIKALLGLSFRYQGFDVDKSLSYGKQALMLSESSNNKRGIGLSHNNLGDVHWYKGEYAISSDHYLKALKIFERLNRKNELADSYRNVGWIYFKQKNFEAALEYYYKALNMNLQLKRKPEMASNYNDIGIVHGHSKRYDEAIENYQKAFKIQEELKNKEGMAANLGNMAIIYESTGRMDLAIKSIERSSEMAKATGNKQHIAASLLNLGSFYAQDNRLDEAVTSLQSSLALAKELDYKEVMKDCYSNLANVFEKKYNFEKALEYERLLVELKDSIYNEQNSEQINEMTAKYDSEKKELMISSLEKENEIESEKISRERNFKISLLMFCFLLGIFSVVLVRSNMNKKKANQALSYAYKEIGSKNKDITDSINYSKRIQDASLPPRELKYRLFPDAFVFFKPKDIVSGDFYWFAEKDGKKLIAACDCTGHGVPGALMSMIGNNILNQILAETEISQASVILDRLHTEVRKTLKQKEKSESRDGMDIALVVFNSEREISFAGAQRPLWMIRNGEFEEIKGNKFSIGGVQAEEERSFTEHKITLSKGDSFYLFSDGLVDQFGGADGKKFMSRQLKELIMTHFSKPMADQDVIIEKEFENWKQDFEQVDDVLLIGVKIF